MSIKELDLPVPYHPTHDVNDPSKIQSFQDCPRGFFFRYVLGWQKEESNVHLVFGSAWHEAMEHILLNGLENESLIEAHNKLEQIYLEAFPNPETHDRKKNPAKALQALSSYAQLYKEWDDFEVLFTEIAGTVPVRSDRIIHTKVDSIIRDSDGIWSLEHKTTGANSGPWRHKWVIKLQVGAYTHLVNALQPSHFPDDIVQGVKINGAVFRTNDHDFLRIPVRKTSQNMQHFLWEINHWLDQLQWNFEELAKCDPSDDVMTCFPRNAESCGKFGCKYPGLCEAWDNPLSRISAPPPGFEVEFWDPRRRNEEEASYVAKPDETGQITITKKEEQDGSSNSE